MAFAFPDKFIWGTATAGHQVEGDNVNSDFWVMEHVQDTVFREPSGDACDQYHLYEKDIDLLASLGFNAYRFSIEWSRIEPEEGFFSTAQLEHYRRMLTYCWQNEITPFVTLHHFSSPKWVAAKGGWDNMEVIESFAKYTAKVIDYMGDLFGGVCTFNEINLPIALQLSGTLPSNEKLAALPMMAQSADAVGSDEFSAFLFGNSTKSAENMLAAHKKAVPILKAGPGEFPVGLTLALQEIQAFAGGELIADDQRALIGDHFMKACEGDDFIGVQTYSRNLVGPDGAQKPPADTEKTMMGYEFYPHALEETIRWAAEVSGCPIFVTESGLATEDDSRRIAYIDQALLGVKRCLDDGIDVRGYFYWSMLDNFEWMMGYEPKFGLIAVDRATQIRKAKPSARHLGDIARTNTMSTNTISD
jgi:beta-glucosidase